MLSTLVFLTGFCLPAQAEGLSLTDVRLTLGICGPPRASARLLPGDNLIVCFDIVGITADEDGKVRYSIGTELSDAQGKILFRQVPREQKTVAALGGGRLPAFSQVDVGLEQPAGAYKVKVTVTDSGQLQKPVADAGLHRAAEKLRSGAFQRQPRPRWPISRVDLPVAGQTVWLHLAVVGFERAREGGQPDVTLEVRFLDDKGKPTTVKPLTGTVNKDVPAKADALPLQFPLALNRAGNFTLHLKATDKVSGKAVEFSAPFNVRPHR